MRQARCGLLYFALEALIGAAFLSRPDRGAPEEGEMEEGEMEEGKR